MANTLLPIEERILTPDQVELLDRRRRRGQVLLVIGFQTLLVSLLLLLWTGQDLTYTPGWIRPMFFWNAVTFIISVTCLVSGVRLRRGLNEFFSY